LDCARTRHRARLLFALLSVERAHRHHVSALSRVALAGLSHLCVYSLASAFVILTINSVLSTLTCIPFISAPNTHSASWRQNCSMGMGRSIPSQFISRQVEYGILAHQSAIHNLFLRPRSASPVCQTLSVDRLWRPLRNYAHSNASIMSTLRSCSASLFGKRTRRAIAGCSTARLP